MKTLGVTEFKQRCLAIIDRLDRDGLIITKHGKPVARIIPIERSSKELIGSLAGEIAIKGEILTTGSEWDASAES